MLNLQTQLYQKKDATVEIHAAPKALGKFTKVADFALDLSHGLNNAKKESYVVNAATREEMTNKGIIISYDIIYGKGPQTPLGAKAPPVKAPNVKIVSPVKPETLQVPKKEVRQAKPQNLAGPISSTSMQSGATVIERG